MTSPISPADMETAAKGCPTCQGRGVASWRERNSGDPTEPDMPCPECARVAALIAEARAQETNEILAALAPYAQGPMAEYRHNHEVSAAINHLAGWQGMHHLAMTVIRARKP